MVGKRDTKTEVDSEYFKYLKQNNITLAKALTEERLTCKQYLEDRISLQKKLEAALLLNIRYEAIINKLLAESKHTVPVCTAILNSIQQIIKLCSDGVNIPKLLDWENKEKSILPSHLNKRSVSPVVNKTHAVKPMVSGHVIFRPTINLWRLSDADHAEFTRNLDSPSSELTETIDTSSNITNRPTNLPVQGLRPNIYDTPDEDLSFSEINEQRNSEEPLLNGRLETLESVEEESEEENHDEQIHESVFCREAIVVINPLPLSAIKSPQSKKRSSTINEDPLEGPSTLLDDSGQFTSPPRYVSKPRAASTHMALVNQSLKRLNSDSDSSSDDEVKTKRGQNRNVTKRKLVANKEKDESSNNEQKKPLKKKVKKSSNEQTLSPQISNTFNCQPVVVLTRENLSAHETNMTNNSNEDISLNVSLDDQHDRPRRNKLKGSFKEVSLRSKLRRDK